MPEQSLQNQLQKWLLVDEWLGGHAGRGVAFQFSGDRIDASLHDGRSLRFAYTEDQLRRLGVSAAYRRIVAEIEATD